MNKELRAWRIYGAVSALAFVVIAVSAFSIVHQRHVFGTINVQRINVVEPNGTLRMVISDQSRFPGAIVKGKQYPFKRHTAGMIFYNDEGTENGGLIFGGRKQANGTVSSYGHLSFDRYDQDQTFSLDDDQTRNGQMTRLAFIDQPKWPITDIFKLPQSEWKHFIETHPGKEPRLTMERAPDGAVFLALKDKQGRTRIVLSVGAHGNPVIKLLGASGNVIAELPRR